MTKFGNSFLPLISVIYALSALVQPASAADIKTTSWPMYQQNPSHTGYVDVILNPNSFKYDWQANLGHDDASGSFDFQMSSAIVDDKSVYVTHHGFKNGVQSNDTLQAFAINDGHEIWSKSYAGDIFSGPDDAVAQPAIFNNKIYVQIVDATLSGDTGLYAYDANNGDSIFKSSIASQGGLHFASPAIFSGHVYIKGGYYGGVYSFDQANGNQDWLTETPGFDSIVSTPSVNEKHAITYVDGTLNIYDRISGQLITSAVDPNRKMIPIIEYFSPVISDDNNIIVQTAGYMSMYSLISNSFVWSDGDGYIGQPSVDDNYIYASKNGSLVCVDKNTGKVIWQWTKPKEKVNGQLIITKNLILLSTDESIYAISKDTHKATWSYKADGVLSLGMGHLYVVQQPGKLYSFSVS